MELIQVPLLNIHSEIIEQAKKQYKIDIYNDFILENIGQKDYLVCGVFQLDLLIHELMQINTSFDIIASPFMFKQANDKGKFYQIVCVSQSSVTKKLKTININIEEKVISTWEILNS